MKRRLFTLTSALSLLLCAATMVLWVRSGHHRDEVQFRWRGRTYAVASWSDGIGIDNFPQVREAERERTRAEEKWRRRRDEFIAQVQAGKYQGDPDDRLRQFGEELKTIWDRPRPALLGHDIPHFWIAVVACILPAAWLRGWLRDRRSLALQTNAFLCRSCGYDLRATPDRCPECGAVPAWDRRV